jgi:hypothetical protein
MMRSVYRSVLWLHPPAFRRQFAGEMLWIFDEAAAAEGALSLIADGVLSLLRQWVWGAGGWKLAAGALLATLQLLAISGLANVVNSGPYLGRRLPQSLAVDDIAFSQGLLPVFVMLVGFIGFLGVLRARTASRH